MTPSSFSPLFRHPLLRDVLAEDATDHIFAQPLIPHVPGELPSSHIPRPDHAVTDKRPEPSPVSTFDPTTVNVTRLRLSKPRLVSVNGKIINHNNASTVLLESNKAERGTQWTGAKITP